MASLNPADLNDLPEQHQPPRLPQGTIILGLVVIGLVAFFLPLYLISTTIRDDITRSEANLLSVQATLTSISAPAPEAQELMNTLAQVQNSASEIEEASSAILANRTDWPAIMAAINNYNPTQLALTSITHADYRITLNGQAIDDTAVVAYARGLEESNLFSRVVVQSIKIVATPFATPTSTSEAALTPTAAITPTETLTPTTKLIDEYEMDDFQPKDIVLGQPQLHNFHPIYDVDKVKFLAKAGRYYRVFTTDLAAGVDTFLTVSVGGNTYINDDRQPGDLSSEVMFQVGTGHDVEALIGVTNRGQYGPDKRYQIIIEETIPTPTPTPTDTSTPTTTTTPPLTATPTNTVIPTDTPTSTPDPRDVYEPDDTDPKPIAIGETQAHNFYPDNDVDRAKFLAKAERYYRVFTSGLALGVDTSLTVTMDGTIYSNDDRQPGDLSSEIMFQVGAGQDVEAFIEVTNRGQYSPDKWYQITVEEIIPTPTSTPTPTDTATPTDTPTATASSSSRLPGVASLMPSFALAAPSHPSQTMVKWASILLSPSTSQDNSPNAVEFVIVLELKTPPTPTPPPTDTPIAPPTPSETETETPAPSSRLPGIAPPMPSFALAAPSHPLQMMTEWASIFLLQPAGSTTPRHLNSWLFWS
jgi:Tfp pilus assembly protein PilN